MLKLWSGIDPYWSALHIDPACPDFTMDILSCHGSFFRKLWICSFMKWYGIIHESCFLFMYGIPLYPHPNTANLFNQTGKRSLFITMDWQKNSIFLSLHCTCKKPRQYRTIIILQWLNAINREYVCIWVTLVKPYLCITQSNKDCQEHKYPTWRSQSLAIFVKHCNDSAWTSGAVIAFNTCFLPARRDEGELWIFGQNIDWLRQ